ncbi:branched-chain amino acid ABC transporter permease [Reyranella sp. CPCC 100927]|uniref:branched-chain amino acid ABC transporter permease n=1 Tax=Reyranella sp. CPCC 100927 TaxID=2599616 RepID=UPI0011B4D480|nr:branched-chain amino acid ABC transporter permease [Reyranella sp. CPCC 100927]TWS98483.1 branched-chain amino acid ABC transporter permease [Reyranella sp. CPCC 100927]
MTLVAAQIVNGLAIGMLYAVMALGLSIIKGLLNVPNFAHGALFAVGAYVCYTLSTIGAPFAVALLGAFAASAIVGLLIERLGIANLAGSSYLLQVLFLFGTALVIEQSLVLIYGTTGVSLVPPALLSGAANLGFMFLPRYLMFCALVGALAIVAVWLLIEKTKIGSRIRAGIERREMVQCLGIDIGMLLTLGFALGAGMAGLAGGIALPLLGANATSGNDMMAIAFVVLVLGGLGSLYGAVVAGILIGVAQSLATLVAPAASTLLIYVIMTAVLLVGSKGLFGER